MIHIRKHSLLTVFTALALTVPAWTAHATDGHKTKEITEIVGYQVTEGITAPNESFLKMDRDSNELVNFKEFQNFYMLDDEYRIFSEIDIDESGEITVAEFANYNWEKGTTHVESKLHGKNQVKGTNLKVKPVEEQTYFVPVEPTVVDVKPIKQ